MISFALVTEGITDQAVLETILCGYYGEEPDINPLQPLRDATDESRQSEGSFGGWEKVFEYCGLGDLQDALAFNDYLIIQVDTDCGEHPRFGVPLTSGGKDRPEIDIIDDVRKVLVSKLGDDFYQEFQDQILFAISVHSLECWLLPLHANTPKASSQTKSCANRLGRAARIELGKDYQAYKTLSRGYGKKAAIEKARQCSASFDVFLSSLPAN
jgi:hypothetical protein